MTNTRVMRPATDEDIERLRSMAEDINCWASWDDTAILTLIYRIDELKKQLEEK